MFNVILLTFIITHYAILLQVTDKFLDLSIEKTNSAYMLFYERVRKVRG